MKGSKIHSHRNKASDPNTCQTFKASKITPRPTAIRIKREVSFIPRVPFRSRLPQWTATTPRPVMHPRRLRSIPLSTPRRRRGAGRPSPLKHTRRPTLRRGAQHICAFPMRRMRIQAIITQALKIHIIKSLQATYPLATSRHPPTCSSPRQHSAYNLHLSRFRAQCAARARLGSVLLSVRLQARKFEQRACAYASPGARA